MKIKNKQITLKLYDYQYDTIVAIAKSLHISPQEYIRIILDSKVPYENYTKIVKY